jgi:hypothetical protein
MAKNHSKGKDPRIQSTTLSPMCPGGGKKGAHAGIRGKQKDRKAKEWEQNDFWKAY